MEQGDMWQEVRRHLADMAETIDKAVRKVPPFSGLAKAGRPAVNVYATPQELIIQAEVPGVRPEELDVKLREGFLTIEGREDRSAYADCEVLRAERGEPEFRREISLPLPVSEEAEPAATFQNGLLTVRLARRPAEQGKAIRIRVADAPDESAPQ